MGRVKKMKASELDDEIMPKVIDCLKAALPIGQTIIAFTSLTNLMNIVNTANHLIDAEVKGLSLFGSQSTNLLRESVTDAQSN